MPYNPILPYAGITYPYQQQQYQQPQSYSQLPVQQPQQGIIWVDGEVGAKAYQIPQGLPAGTPIALWDTNDQVIYLKSINQMGMPNPIQRIRYQMEEQPTAALTGDSGNYVTKDDFEQIKDELKELKKLIPQNQNGSQNRGGNR